MIRARDNPYKLTKLEKIERFLRRYVGLRFRNQTWVAGLLVGYASFFKLATGFSLTSDLTWAQISEKIFTLQFFIAFASYTFVAFLSPDTKGINDSLNKTGIRELPDIRLMILDQKALLYESYMKEVVFKTLDVLDDDSKREVEIDIEKMTGIKNKNKKTKVEPKSTEQPEQKGNQNGTISK